MYRLALVAVVALAACAQTENDRPATLEYITEAILQPSCAQHTCHSSYRNERGLAFDTVGASRRSLHVALPKLPPLVVKGDVEGSGLYVVLTRTLKRMPYDAPLPDKDIDLIATWITKNAPGLDP